MTHEIQQYTANRTSNFVTSVGLFRKCASTTKLGYELKICHIVALKVKYVMAPAKKTVFNTHFCIHEYSYIHSHWPLVSSNSN